jgi:large subunit ribosomal protein L22
MIARAEGRFLKISPTKARQVAALLKHQDVPHAQGILALLNKRPKEYLIKILASAVANAKVKGFSPDKLYISRIICNTAPTWKRYKAAAFGRAAPILRRTAHIRIELDLKT